MNNFLNRRNYFIGKLLSCSLVLLFAVAVLSANAQEWVLVDLNFAITTPSTWVDTTNLPMTQNVVFMRKAPDSKKMVIVRMDPNPPYKGAINDSFVTGMERSLEQSGDKLVSSNFVQISGIPAYKRIGIRTARGKQVVTYLLGVIADGKSYSVQAIHNGGVPGEDEEIRQILSSFRFLVTPKLQAYSPASQSSAIGGQNEKTSVPPTLPK